jgi:hypothetical protein
VPFSYRGRTVFLWVVASLLLANALIILTNLLDFPPTPARHVISFVAACGLIAGLFFIVMEVLRFLDI